MATLRTKKQRPIEYPTSDGKPMAETDFHFAQMVATRQVLDDWFADDPMVYVSSNLLMYYVRDNKRKHVSPDVFVVKGVEKKKRLYYLTWEEGKTPNAIIEVTSKSTRKEDTDTKFALYRDVLKVKEYFLFDPFGDYLKPDRLRGYRLRKGEYVPITLVDGRMPSQVFGLHLERNGDTLRLYDPATKSWLKTADERADEAQQRADQAERHSAALAEENERLRKELEKLHRRNGA
ncbi:MAG TPA: Uma2 family endonuclease [Gemmataceae bacterium]|nr:Uma2 family endonuclease [Gemmataceae bacterium]